MPLFDPAIFSSPVFDTSSFLDKPAQAQVAESRLSRRGNRKLKRYLKRRELLRLFGEYLEFKVSSR